MCGIYEDNAQLPKYLKGSFGFDSEFFFSQTLSKMLLFVRYRQNQIMDFRLLHAQAGTEIKHPGFQDI